jgi:hypothetical protein
MLIPYGEPYLRLCATRYNVGTATRYIGTDGFSRRKTIHTSRFRYIFAA